MNETLLEDLSPLPSPDATSESSSSSSHCRSAALGSPTTRSSLITPMNLSLSAPPAWPTNTPAPGSRSSPRLDLWKRLT